MGQKHLSEDRGGSWKAQTWKEKNWKTQAWKENPQTNDWKTRTWTYENRKVRDSETPYGRGRDHPKHKGEQWRAQDWLEDQPTGNWNTDDGAKQEGKTRSLNNGKGKSWDWTTRDEQTQDWFSKRARQWDTPHWESKRTKQGDQAPTTPPGRPPQRATCETTRTTAEKHYDTRTGGTRIFVRA